MYNLITIFDIIGNRCKIRRISMTHDKMVILLSIVSYLFFPIGVLLFFTHKSKQEAQWFGFLAILGFFSIGFFYRLIT